MKNSCYTILFILCLVETQLPATTPIGGVAGSLSVTNSIIYNDLTYLQVDPTNTNITYTAVRGSAVTGIGNLTISSFSALKDALAAPVDTFSYYLSPATVLTDVGSIISSTIPAYMPFRYRRLDRTFFFINYSCFSWSI